ncbi:MAG: hypothetical protein IPM37_04730 [Hahellaceae bacterium]|nr:hypothetical protein [Hahellaceae bacterium]
MRVSLPFFRKPKAGFGLELAPDRMALAFSRAVDGELRISQSLTVTCSLNQRAKQIAEWVEAHGLKQQTCHIVLSPDSYQLFQVEKPAVPPEELRDVARWRVKDMLESSIDDVVVDCFDFPDDALRGRPPQMTVVVARKDYLKPFVSLLHQHDVHISSIDITELALRNLLAPHLPESETRCVLLLLVEGGLIVLLKGAQVYLTRKLEKDRFYFGAGADIYAMGPSIALEIQRSFDYLESQLGQSPPRTIHIGSDQHEDELKAILSNELGVEIQSMSELAVHNDKTHAITAQEWVACGAALRGRMGLA